MRIPSGKVDIVAYFVAVDSADLVTRKTGLTSFTVYRSRNGGTATIYTTPTITELSAANMPGVYCLLIDEDTTLASTSDSEEYAIHVTQASMAPVTRVIELFRRDSTSGRTQTVDASGRVDIGSLLGTAWVTPATAGTPDVNVKSAAGTAWNSGAITANTFAAGAITAAKFATNALDAVWSTAVRVLTAGTNIVLAKGTGVTGFNDLSASDVRDAVGLAAASLDTQLAAIYTRIGAPVTATISTDLQALSAQIAALNLSSVLDLADGVEPGLTVRQTLRGMTSALLGKASGLGTTTPAFRDFNDTKDRITPVVDQFGNRSNVTLDLS